MVTPYRMNHLVRIRHHWNIDLCDWPSHTVFHIEILFTTDVENWNYINVSWKYADGISSFWWIVEVLNSVMPVHWEPGQWCNLYPPEHHITDILQKLIQDLGLEMYILCATIPRSRDYAISYKLIFSQSIRWMQWNWSTLRLVWHRRYRHILLEMTVGLYQYFVLFLYRHIHTG